MYRKSTKGGAKMDKKITNIGKCAGIILNKTLLALADMAIGETVEITCGKGEIIIKKKGE